MSATALLSRAVALLDSRRKPLNTFSVNVTENDSRGVFSARPLRVERSPGLLVCSKP